MLRVGENGADSLDSQDLTAHHDRLAGCLAGGFPLAVLIFSAAFLLPDPLLVLVIPSEIRFHRFPFSSP